MIINVIILLKNEDFQSLMRVLESVMPIIEVDRIEKEKAIQETKDLLRLIDKAHGIKTQKGKWE